MGKVIGGGLPVGAIGGPATLMDHFAPTGPIYQAGTLSGNPLAMSAGLATLQLLDDAAYERLERSSERLEQGLAEAAAEAGIALHINRVGSMMGLFFNDTPVGRFDEAKASDAAAYGVFFNELLDHGVYLAPSAFEAAFVSMAHGDEEIERTLAAAQSAFAKVKAQQ
jgi:glutamate-1-semialdehyde 2,1-aminomutase